VRCFVLLVIMILCLLIFFYDVVVFVGVDDVVGVDV